jgi:hypothetical protein
MENLGDEAHLGRNERILLRYVYGELKHSFLIWSVYWPLDKSSPTINISVIARELDVIVTSFLPVDFLVLLEQPCSGSHGDRDLRIDKSRPIKT